MYIKGKSRIIEWGNSVKKRWMLPFLLLVFLFAGTSQVQAETAQNSEKVELSGEERYDAEYYAKPQQRFSVKQKGAGTGLSLEAYIVKALENFETEIDVSAYNIPRSQAGQEYLRILNNNPQLFFVKDTVTTFYSGGKAISYQVSYTVGKTKAMQMRENMESVAQRAIDLVDESMSAAQKALVVHDYLVQNCEYDYERLRAGTLPDISHTAYGALVEGIAVCDGYAKAYNYIMDHKLGISCTMVSSDPMNHAWNMIEIDGKWYHVDLTWDDPVWDSVGRVNHFYFLLSDQAISQNSPNAPTQENNHYAWTQGYTADDSRYEGEFWTDVDSAICYYNGAWYHSMYDSDRRKVVLVKKNEMPANVGDVVFETECWQSANGGNYTYSFMYLAQADGRLYFNTRSGIMQMDENDKIQVFYEPEDLAGKQIFGFTVRDNKFLYAPQVQYVSEKQSDIRSYSLAKIEGITANNVTGVYNGKPYAIDIQGLKEGDTVQYALTGAKYGKIQPEMINAGTYRVRYRVLREGYAAFEGSVTVTIAKAEIECTVPEGCVGKSGGTLADVKLPEGFQWKDVRTKLFEEGEYSYPAVYIPADAVNYQTKDVEIRVKVTCPGHEWTSKVTKQPTEQAEGIRTYTCKYCGNTYTEKIAKKIKKKTETVNISQNAKVTLGVTTYVYDGKQHKPAISVKYDTKTLIQNRDYIVSYQNNKNVGTALLTVTGIGGYTGKIVKKFTIAPKGTRIRKLPKAKKTSLTVNWEKQKKSIDGYEIWTSTSKYFTKSATIKKKAKKSAVKLTVKKLKKKTKYYVKVRTYKKVNGKKYYSSWSNVRYVRTKKAT